MDTTRGFHTNTSLTSDPHIRPVGPLTHVGRGRGANSVLFESMPGCKIDARRPSEETTVGVCSSINQQPSAEREESRKEVEVSILVHDVSNVSRDLLYLFFENKKKCGGDDIENIDISNDGSTALIKYGSPAVAQRVLAKGPLFKINTSTLIVQKPQIPDPRSIKIEGISQGISADVLMLYFENIKRSGGTDVVDIQYIKGSGKAVVTFENVHVSQRVLQNRQLHLGGVPLTATPLSLKDLLNTASQIQSNVESSTTSSMSCADSLTSDISEAGLTIYLEDKKFRDGAIKRPLIEKHEGRALFQYADSAVAQRMLSNDTIRIPSNKPNADYHSSQLSDKASARKTPCGINTLQIVNIPCISKNYLKLVLQEKCHGEVDCISMSDDSQGAMVKFKQERDVAHLLERGITIENKTYRLIPLYTMVHEQLEGNLAIKVHGLTPNITTQLLDMYFNNRRKSGGYDVKSIVMSTNHDEAIITFNCTDAVQSVMGMQYKSGLMLKNVTILAEIMTPLPPPPYIMGPAEPRIFVMIEAPAVGKDELERFLSLSRDEPSVGMGISNDSSIIKLLYGYQKQVLLMEFQTIPDYDAMLATCVSTPFKDRMTSLEKVATATMIQVRAWTALDKEDLELYFESDRNGGGEIIGEIELFHQEQCAVIDFGKPEVVQSVLMKKHQICGQDVEVDTFYPSFGTWPPDHDPFRPWHLIPSPFKFSIHDPLIVEFLSAKPEALDRFNEFAEVSGFRVNPVSISDTELHVSYVQDNSGIVPEQKLWEQSSRQQLGQLCDLILVKRFAIIGESFHMICEEATKLIPKDTSVLLKPLNDASVLVLAGWKDQLGDFVTRLGETVWQVKESFTRQSKSKAEKIPLKSYEVKLIEAWNYAKQFKKEFPKLELCMEREFMSLTGLPDEIATAKLFLYENILHKIKLKQCPFSNRIMKFLQDKSVQSFIMSEYQNNNIRVVFECCNQFITLYGMSDVELQSGEVMLQQSIVSKEIELQAENLPVLQHPKWSALKATLNNDHKGMILIEEDRRKKTIFLTTLCDICDVILEEIQNILTEYTVLEKTYDLEGPVMDLLSRFHEDKIEDIAKNIQCTVSIHPSRHCYVLRGNCNSIQAAILAFDALYVQLVTKDHTIPQSVMAYYLCGSDGKEDIKLLEKVCQAVCVDSSTIGRVTSGNKLSGSEELHSTKINHTIIKVLFGDITKQPIDVMVNAANGNLKHSGGLAAAIVNAGGSEIQNECDRYMQGRSTLLAGEVYVSKPGCLPCKILIHAVGPKWSGGNVGEANELFESVSQCLEETEKAHLKSIAIPVISSGIFGFPVDKATTIICTAIVDFLKQNTSTGIETIHLIDNDRNRGQSLIASLNNCVGQVEIVAGAKPKSIASKLKSFLMGGHSSTIKSMTVSRADMFYTPEGISIKIKKGSLVQEQVDVLVNTTRKSFQLNSGGVSSAIFSEAGNIIQQECSMKITGRIRAGEIVSTSGGNLSVKCIFHGYLDQWDGGKHLKRFISNALNKAHQNGYRSIAFPALGTGNLGYDPTTVAKLMVEEVLKFSSIMQTTNLKDVRVVLFSSDVSTTKAFESFWKYKTGSTPTGSSTVRRLCKERANPSQLYNIIQETNDKMAVQIGLLTVSLVKGDITKQTTDVIMNNTDHLFSTQGAISKAINKAGGPTIKVECDKILSRYGVLTDIALTNAGTLLCRKIMHVNLQSGENWYTLIIKMLQVAEENQMKSLALPAIGSGTLKANRQSTCQTILKSLVTFALEKNPKHLQVVNIVIFDRTMFKEYKTHMGDVFKGKQLGILPKMSDDEESKPLTYRIYALSQAAVDDFATKLDTLCKNKIQKHVLQDKEDQEIIAILQPHDIMAIKNLEKEFKSKIEVHQGSRLNRIVVEGDLKNLTPCISRIVAILHKIQAEHIEQENANLIYQQVRWQFIDMGHFADYPPEINYIIEKAHVKKELTASWKEENGSIVVFFDKMIERRNSDSSTDAQVKRQIQHSSAGNSVQLPSSWSPVQQGQICIQVKLNASSPEYMQVAKKFRPGNIISIERIQNPNLYQMYEVRKQQMDKTNQQVQNEKLLYHGTSEQSVQNINNFGFNRSYCGKHGTAIGEGVYFAADATYSASSSYSQPNAMGQKRIYQAKVLIGNSCVGRGGMKEPPYMNGSSGQRFDSVHDNGNSMYVIFHDTQAYPEYLITFR